MENLLLQKDKDKIIIHYEIADHSQSACLTQNLQWSSKGS